ncbi:hypothetical protein T05_1012 [Trichinella murrelli]|uniref:Uncharacterized protein n=1 Tax=Trichinella murrelli TaxID=144512 RepID=A0A0V0T2A4_9BILA|nr:hypothetical protein T05_13278 [Trichinella murrelli]KRX33111.1 hypothetical protein T05_1012 [Trichinella murrelli]
MKNGIPFSDPLAKNIAFVMLQTHKYHINTAITETCIKQPITISYMLEIICIEGSVENAYMGLTEEERQHN